MMEVQDYQAVTYPVVETFHSVQGEGYWTGVNAFFIRLGGCDVHCPWCDQKETWSSKGYPLVKSVELAHIAEASNCAIVIITGGEPLLHDLLPLTTSLKNLGLRIHLETSGAHPLRGEFDWLTFSPKPYRAPQQSVISQADELKVVIQKPEDIIWAETQAKNIPAHTLKYLQPEWGTSNSREIVFNYVLEHPDWRISLQTHKYLQVR